MTYYEIEIAATPIEGLPKFETIAFDTLEDAIDYANENGCERICTIGGNFEEWEKCAFCDEWTPTSELNIENYCEYCQVAIKDHGFRVDPRKKNDIY